MDKKVIHMDIENTTKENRVAVAAREDARQARKPEKEMKGDQ